MHGARLMVHCVCSKAVRNDVFLASMSDFDIHSEDTSPFPVSAEYPNILSRASHCEIRIIDLIFML
jgi:hypothetical protein